jgi:hypothetical protein
MVQTQRHANVSLSLSLAAVLLAGLWGCSKHALKAASSDAGSGREDATAPAGADVGTDTIAPTPDAGVPDLPVLPDAANPADAPADIGGIDAAADSARDACVPVACTDEYGESFCGTICDGCGHTLNCGETCPHTGWMCRNNVCTGPTAVCTSLLCMDSSDESEYCGDVGDGCGGTLHCPFVCTKAGWTCEDNMCVGHLGCASHEPVRMASLTIAATSATGAAAHFIARPPARRVDGFAATTSASVPRTCAPS